MDTQQLVATIAAQLLIAEREKGALAVALSDPQGVQRAVEAANRIVTAATDVRG